MISRDEKSVTTFRALLRSVGLLKRVMEPFFLQYGISGPQWGVLRVLYSAEADGVIGLRLIDLGSRLLIRPPSVTGVIDRLQRLGLVRRQASETDMRAKNVMLTDAGRQLVQRVLGGHAARVEQMFSGLDRQERQALQGLLERLNLHLEQMASHEERMVERSLADGEDAPAGNEV